MLVEIGLNQHSGSQIVLPVSVMDSCFKWGLHLHLPLEQQSWENGGEGGTHGAGGDPLQTGGEGESVWGGCSSTSTPRSSPPS